MITQKVRHSLKLKVSNRPRLITKRSVDDEATCFEIDFCLATSYHTYDRKAVNIIVVFYKLEPTVYDSGTFEELKR